MDNSAFFPLSQVMNAWSRRLACPDGENWRMIRGQTTPNGVTTPETDAHAEMNNACASGNEKMNEINNARTGGKNDMSTNTYAWTECPGALRLDGEMKRNLKIPN